jgi:hypothetical protein
MCAHYREIHATMTLWDGWPTENGKARLKALATAGVFCIPWGVGYGRCSFYDTGPAQPCCVPLPPTVPGGSCRAFPGHREVDGMEVDYGALGIQGTRDPTPAR